MDNCPLATMYRQVNLDNHLLCMRLANLGPADPREPSVEFWQAKMAKWNVPEGEARSRLCMNCEEYIATQEMIDCAKSGPGGKLKASEVDPSWADIEGLPFAICARYNITCSSLRTCDDWEPGGPITDVSMDTDGM